MSDSALTKTMMKTYLKHVWILALFGMMACTSEQLEPIVDCNSSPISLTINETLDTGCGASSGGFTVSAAGGEGPYTYSTNAIQNSTGVFEDMVAGNYTVTATDQNGCSGEIQVSITNLDGVNLDDVSVTDAGCGTENGQVTIEVSGGEKPYTYRLNDGEPQSDNVFTNLPKGSHEVSVSDQLGCEVTETVQVLSGVSYASSVKAIIENNCAVSGCHNGSISPNFTTFATIQSKADRIKARTGNKSMPQGSSLSQTEIDLIACWVDDGASDN